MLDVSLEMGENSIFYLPFQFLQAESVMERAVACCNNLTVVEGIKEPLESKEEGLE